MCLAASPSTAICVSQAKRLTSASQYPHLYTGQKVAHDMKMWPSHGGLTHCGQIRNSLKWLYLSMYKEVIMFFSLVLY